MNKDLMMAQEIAKQVAKRGGRAYYVGGYVRDELMGRVNDDIDIEIHGIEREVLVDILRQHGELIETGADFGVYGIDGYELDLALPRQEKAIGRGHKDFEVVVDPFLGTKEAAIRRDFTINALMKDVLRGEIVDHFHGLDHLKEKKIVAVNGETFVEDALRLFRAAQFASRFEFEVDSATIDLCKSMDASNLARERVFKEMSKALLKADKPSIFFEELARMNHLSFWFPEVEQLKGVQQSPKYHMEGDVWVHTMMVLDQAAKRRERVKEPLPFMVSALCHDFGKIVATEKIKGQFHAYGHEVKGLPLVATFLDRICREKHLSEYVLNMVKYHMKPHVLGNSQSKVKKTNQMFDQSVEPYDLIQLSECDARSSLHEEPFVSNEAFLLERLNLFQEMMQRPYVMGRDLVEAGLKPDKNFGDILAHAHKLRLAGVDKENALYQTLAYARKKKE